MRFAPIILAGAVLSMAACAPSTQGAGATSDRAEAARCFRIDDIRNFRAANMTDLYVRTSRDKVYQITTTGGCWNMDNALALSITPTLGGSSNVCLGDMVNVFVPGGMPGSGRCRGTVTKSLTPDEVAAMPSRSRP